ncbi:hypothetical protein HPB51_029215 [Rhipicephalus microplus]|uniref:Organic cation/carnitine transporter n=1 Tax=Rhipicephalus microplus TaxID=6941 RepID=A0A9J6CV64_RHIMP|nr:hypothetical protein HPB51_029215 [Rhipicephalus microplus]
MDLFFPQRLARYDLRTSESFDCQEAFGYGPFQRRLFILLILSAFSLISQTSILTIVFGDVDHWCRRPRGSNISATEWKNIAIPLEADGRLSHCRIYERCLPLVDLNFPSGMDSVMHAQLDQLYNECLNAANDTRDVPCKEWDYDDSVADSTAVSTWNMVCHQRLIKTTVVALQYAGAVIIVLTSGMYADSLSRKSCLVASASALVATTVCSVLANTYHVYALARFLAGGLTAVSEIFSIVIPFEVTTHAHRPQQVILWHLVGVFLAQLWEILMIRMPMFWQLKQLVFLAPSALLLPVSFTAPESPRWLVAKGRLREAETVMMQAAETNNFPLPDTAALIDKLKEQVEPRMVTASDKEILDTNSLRRRALALFFAYFSMAFSYYVAVFATAAASRCLDPVWRSNSHDLGERSYARLGYRHRPGNGDENVVHDDCGLRLPAECRHWCWTGHDKEHSERDVKRRVSVHAHSHPNVRHGALSVGREEQHVVLGVR